MAEALLRSLRPDPAHHCQAYEDEIAEARKELDARRQRALLAVACVMGDAETGEDVGDGPSPATEALEVALAAEASSASREPVDEALRVAAARMLRVHRSRLAARAEGRPPAAPALKQQERGASLRQVFTAPEPPTALDASAVSATNDHVRAILGGCLAGGGGGDGAADDAAQ